MKPVSSLARTTEPELTLLDTPGEHGQVNQADSQSKNCAWSFCSGQDSELPSSPDEEINLINLREVHFNYGSPVGDTDQEPEVHGAPCSISDATWNITGGIVKAVTGLALTASAVAEAVWGYQMLNSKFPGEFESTFYPALMIGPGAMAIGFTAWGVKDLVEAYKERGNA